MKKTAVYKWVKRFSEGRESVTNEESSGRPSTSRTEENIAKIRQIMRKNRRLTVRGIAEQVNIDRETVRKILTEGVCKNGPKGAHRRTKAKKSFNARYFRRKLLFHTTLKSLKPQSVHHSCCLWY